MSVEPGATGPPRSADAEGRTLGGAPSLADAIVVVPILEHSSPAEED